MKLEAIVKLPLAVSLDVFSMLPLLSRVCLRASKYVCRRSCALTLASRRGGVLMFLLRNQLYTYFITAGQERMCRVLSSPERCGDSALPVSFAFLATFLLVFSIQHEYLLIFFPQVLIATRMAASVTGDITIC